jgi:hypothetical protein
MFLPCSRKKATLYTSDALNASRRMSIIGQHTWQTQVYPAESLVFDRTVCCYHPKATACWKPCRCRRLLPHLALSEFCNPAAAWPTNAMAL